MTVINPTGDNNFLAMRSRCARSVGWNVFSGRKITRFTGPVKNSCFHYRLCIDLVVCDRCTGGPGIGPAWKRSLYKFLEMASRRSPATGIRMESQTTSPAVLVEDRHGQRGMGPSSRHVTGTI